MVQTVIVLIRVTLALALGALGIFAFLQGFVMIAHQDFALFGSLGVAMLMGLAIGTAMLFGSWRLLATTLHMP